MDQNLSQNDCVLMPDNCQLYKNISSKRSNLDKQNFISNSNRIGFENKRSENHCLIQDILSMQDEKIVNEIDSSYSKITFLSANTFKGPSNNYSKLFLEANNKSQNIQYNSIKEGKCCCQIF